MYQFIYLNLFYLLKYQFKLFQLQLFSLQILHRDNTFTANGISMDACLIKSVNS